VDDPSNGELARRLQAFHDDIKEDFRDLAKRLDAKVSLERYEFERRAADDVHRQVIERVAAIEEARMQEQRQADADRRTAEDRRRADRRLAFTALIAPVLLLLLQTYLSARGASS
jgi:ferric-dicitrate binding protein FerR (iron transport regulator)